MDGALGRISIWSSYCTCTIMAGYKLALESLCILHVCKYHRSSHWRCEKSALLVYIGGNLGHDLKNHDHLANVQSRHKAFVYFLPFPPSRPFLCFRVPDFWCFWCPKRIETYMLTQHIPTTFTKLHVHAHHKPTINTT